MRRTVRKELPSTLDVSVSREYRCGGIRLDIHVKGDRWCLVVENKMGDFAWEHQISGRIVIGSERRLHTERQFHLPCYGGGAQKCVTPRRMLAARLLQ